MPHRRKSTARQTPAKRKTTPRSLGASLTPDEQTAMAIICETDYLLRDTYGNGGARPPRLWLDHGRLLERARIHQWSMAQLEAQYPALRQHRLIAIQRSSPDTPPIVCLTRRGHQLNRALWGELP